MLYSGSEFRWHPHFFWMLESWLHTTRSTLSLQEDIEDVFMKLLPPKATRHGESPAAYRCYQLYIGWQTEGRSLKKMQPWWQYFQHKGKARWLYMTWLSPCSYEILWVVHMSYCSLTHVRVLFSKCFQSCFISVSYCVHLFPSLVLRCLCCFFVFVHISS